MEKNYRHLSAEEREQIAIGLAQGCSVRAIARTLQRPASTISREIQRNGEAAGRYGGVVAHRVAQERRRRARRPARLRPHRSDHRLWSNVLRHLRRGLSPQQTARRLRERHPHQPEYWVSYQTIYRAIHILPRGELKRDLITCLRRAGRAYKTLGEAAPSRRADDYGTSNRGGRPAHGRALGSRSGDRTSEVPPGDWRPL